LDFAMGVGGMLLLLLPMSLLAEGSSLVPIAVVVAMIATVMAAAMVATAVVVTTIATAVVVVDMAVMAVIAVIVMISLMKLELAVSNCQLVILTVVNCKYFSEVQMIVVYMYPKVQQAVLWAVLLIHQIAIFVPNPFHYLSRLRIGCPNGLV
jgi:hypothetical protein